MRLNKYLSKSGIASRRESDNLIQMGTTEVNGLLCLDPAYQVKESDVVSYDGKKIKPEINKIVLMLHKPPKIITTVKDTHGRKTVLDIIEASSRVVPIGRLDKDTTGLLLFTNDGALAKELTHPKHEVSKIYNVSLNKSVSQRDMEAIKSGVKLEDGLIKTDDIRYTDNSHNTVQLTIHSGKNRIIRRLFSFFNYDVKKLDRVGYSFLNKNNLKQGKWRILTVKEVTELKKNH